MNRLRDSFWEGDLSRILLRFKKIYPLNSKESWTLGSDRDIGTWHNGRLGRMCQVLRFKPTEITKNSRLIKNNSLLFLRHLRTLFYVNAMVKCSLYTWCQLQNLLAFLPDFLPAQSGESECHIRLFAFGDCLKSDFDSIGVRLIFNIQGAFF